MSQKTVAVELTADELVLLSNAINEALELVDESEFQTRVGHSRARADELRRRLRSILGTLQEQG